MKPNKITIHCSATPPSMVHIGVHALRQMHIERGFSDIGYHFIVTRDGHWSVGRPISKQGAGVFGHNENNIHICMAGGVDKNGKPENNFTDAMFSTLRYHISELCSIYGIKPEKIKGHRDYSPDKNGDGVIDKQDWLKDCPCFSVADKLEGWKI